MIFSIIKYQYTDYSVLWQKSIQFTFEYNLLSTTMYVMYKLFVSDIINN